MSFRNMLAGGGGGLDDYKYSNIVECNRKPHSNFRGPYSEFRVQALGCRVADPLGLSLRSLGHPSVAIEAPMFRPSCFSGSRLQFTLRLGPK